MTDDIVTRLRDYLAIVDHAFVLNELSDAADEIERLRTDRDRWRNHAQEIVLVRIQFWEGTGDGVVLSENPPWPDYYRIFARHLFAFHEGWDAVDEEELANASKNDKLMGDEEPF